MSTSVIDRPAARHSRPPDLSEPPGQRPDSRWRRIVRGPRDAPRWARPALLGLLLSTAVLYLWGLSASGYANSFYAAAVQAGTQSWKALLFGSLDAGNAITVDKPPAALWIMGISGRLFGFNSWSLLVPQALEGVAAVGLLYGAVRRWSGHAAGLLAGAILAVTPVAVLMFRFDNPDALLVLLLTAGAYAVVRAVEKASAGWLMLAGVAVGFGFLTKMMQAFLVLPAFGLVYLLAAPTPLRRRLLHLMAATAAMVVSAGWYVALIELWPASSRPYIGGSTNNSLLELALGYNGLSRILGGAGNGGGGGGGGTTNTGFGGATGITRLFSTSMGAEISWLLPAALIAFVAGLWLTRRAPRTDRIRAALLLWGGWLLVTGLVFSYMSGTTHPYYTVALAPAIGALVAIGGREMWRQRALPAARMMLAALVVATATWDFVLLGRTPSWLPALRWIVLGAGAAAAVTLLLTATARRRAALAAAVAAVVIGLTGTSAYALATASQAHSGSIPTSGPVASSGMGGGMGGRTDGAPAGGGMGSQPSGVPGGQTSGASDTTGAAAGMGGAGGSGEQGGNAELAALLKASGTRWAAAVAGDQSAAELELSSGASVMAIGGWSGSDPAPTLVQFQQYVASGQIHYLVAAGGSRGGPGGSSGTYSEILTWVQAHYTATTVGSTTVYDLTAAAS
jgi:4-amino-4-deoxy-L-arabinose transferase-like glycosyltransferase